MAIALFGICLLSELLDRVEQDVVLKVGIKKSLQALTCE